MIQQQERVRLGHGQRPAEGTVDLRPAALELAVQGDRGVPRGRCPLPRQAWVVAGSAGELLTVTAGMSGPDCLECARPGFELVEQGGGGIVV